MNKLIKTFCCGLTAVLLSSAVFAQNNPVANNSYVASMEDYDIYCYLSDNNTMIMYPDEDYDEAICVPYFYNPADKTLYLFESFEDYPEIEYGYALKYNAAKKEIKGEIDDDKITFKFQKKGTGVNPLLNKTYTFTLDSDSLELLFLENGIIFITMKSGSEKELLVSRYVYDTASNSVFFFDDYNSPEESICLRYNTDTKILYGEVDGEYVEMTAK